MPGRFGYQFSNYYRRLVSQRVIDDPNYTVKKGKLIFHGRGTSSATTKRRSSNNKRKKSQSLSYSENERKQKRKRPQEKETEETCLQPERPSSLPNLICPMTFEPIPDPAASPYRHIMGFNTWMRVLSQEPRNTHALSRNKNSLVACSSNLHQRICMNSTWKTTVGDRDLFFCVRGGGHRWQIGTNPGPSPALFLSSLVERKGQSPTCVIVCLLFGFPKGEDVPCSHQ